MSPAAPDSRVERLVATLAEHELDTLLVGDLVRPGDSGREAGADVRWLTGFGGTSGVCVVGADSRLFVTDFRYAARAEHEVAPSFERIVAEEQLVRAAVERLSGRTGYDESKTSVRVLGRMQEWAPAGVELVPVSGVVEAVRRVKDEQEVDAISAAAALTDKVFAQVAERGLAGRAEREVARAAELQMRELGAEAAAFPIVASGPNGALPHAEPGERKIAKGELVVVDMGAVLDGYCSDGTRTFAVGEPGAEGEVYELVLSAQDAALAGIGPGIDGTAADALARNVIAAAGHEDVFGHGLGHGVGLEVHEAPRLGKGSEDVLGPGDVVTVEPGVYLEGRFGVRIEDLVVITSEGVRNLSSAPKALDPVD